MNEKPVGIVSLGGYIPGKELNNSQVNELTNYLKTKTLLNPEYIQMIANEQKMPGNIETNEDGWTSQPWYEAWVKSLPAKKQENPFQGTKERRRVPMDPVSVRESVIPHPMLPSDAETIAGSMALMNWGGDKNDIDLVITHSQVRDHSLPSNASLVQHKLQLEHAGAFEVDSCCSTFVTLVQVATAMVKTGMKKNVLVVNSILDSHINDKTTYWSVDTGDAAMAAVITNVEEDYGYHGSFSSSHGEYHDGIIFKRRSPMLYKGTSSGAQHDQEYVTFENPVAVKGIGKSALENLKEVVDKLYVESGFKQSDIDFFITHQPVAWAPNHWREGLGFAENQFYQSFEKYANVATCSVPVNLWEAIEKDLIKAGDNVLLASSGAGENHIALIQKISPVLVENVKRFAGVKHEFVLN